MKIEKFSAIFLIAGIGFFFLAFVTLVASPWWMLKKVPMATVEDLAQTPDEYFLKMSETHPEKFKAYFGEVNSASYAKALRLGRDVYVREGCWHCHSQFVRPVSNEDQRFGPVSTPTEYQNELQLPQLFGTRRVGPDLIRTGGKYDNSWHYDHLKNPPALVPGSVMPTYPWLFDAQGDPTQNGMALVTYLQWLGTWPPAEGFTEDWNEEGGESEEAEKGEKAEAGEKSDEAGKADDAGKAGEKSK